MIHNIYKLSFPVILATFELLHGMEIAHFERSASVPLRIDDLQRRPISPFVPNNLRLTLLNTGILVAFKHQPQNSRSVEDSLDHGQDLSERTFQFSSNSTIFQQHIPENSNYRSKKNKKIKKN